MEFRPSKGVKQYLLFSLLLICIAICSLTSCTSDKFIKNSYATLESARVIYDTIMTLAVDMKMKGNITDDEWNDLMETITPFRVSGLLASQLIDVYVSKYNQDPTSQATSDARLSASNMLSILSDNYTTILPVLDKFGITSKLPTLLLNQ